MPVQSGKSARGDWSKQEFLIEYQEGNYPSNAVFSVWGQDKVNDLARFAEGSDVKVSFNINSREYNGRWYTDLRAWRVQLEQGEAPAAPAPSQPMAGQSVPAGFAPSTGFAAPSNEPQNDDLPF